MGNVGVILVVHSGGGSEVARMVGKGTGDEDIDGEGLPGSSFSRNWVSVKVQTHEMRRACWVG